MIDSDTGAPESFEDLVIHYGDFVKSLVIRYGIAYQDAEDISQEILLKFYERDALSWFDGDKLHPAGKTMKRARFASFLRAFVSKYVLSHRDKQHTRARKEPFRLEHLTEDESGGTWGDSVPDDSQTAVLEMADFSEWLDRVSEYLAALPERGRAGELHVVFVMAVSSLFETGAVDRKAIAAHYEVSDTAVTQMFRDLRHELVEAGFRDSEWAGLG